MLNGKDHKIVLVIHGMILMSYLQTMCNFNFNGNTFNITSNKLDIIGIDADTINTLLPISILVAIALSPASLQMLVANSASIAIPVIFSSTITNLLFIEALFV